MRYATALWLLTAMLAICQPACAQRFFNLTSSQVEIDSVMPEFSYSLPLEGSYEDSVYTVSILYPEFIDMTNRDLTNYEALTDDELPEMPLITQRIAVSRKKASLEVFFRPLVMREGRGQILVSFMLKVEATPKTKAERRALAKTRAAGTASRYAAKSVLAEGKWAKIRVPETGLYQLTDAYVRKLGFTSLARVKVYGYGGNLQPEKLDAEYLAAHDDLKEVPVYEADGRKVFYGLGPVTWSTNSSARRTRNPYSDYGYYFLTENDAEPLTADSADFVKAFYPSPDYYHTISESDGFAWYHGGRNLFDVRPIPLNSTQTTVFSNEAGATTGKLTVNITAGVVSTASVMINDSLLGNISVSQLKYYTGNEETASYSIKGLHAKDTVKITTIAGGPVHLDFVSMAWTKAKPAPELSRTYPSPEYVYHITNQNLHADSAIDMVIIIPTSQKLRAQADRLADFHRSHDGLRVKVVPADELFNEFSSGTPDANAYRRYLKMLYDRAVDDKDMPRFLLLFGDCVWDNRMLTSNCRTMSPDDYLLAYESENSFSETTCYVDDGYFCLLDDGEGGSLLTSDKPDVAVGRFPVTTDAEAKIIVDKTINYVENNNAGSWQNTLVFLGDDGDANVHMRDINSVADETSSTHPGYLVKKVMWDAYQQETSATGNTYPEVRNTILKQQAAGALVIDYGGHGRPDQISHENVLRLTDFVDFSNTNLPLWITASCDIMPFDGVVPTIGETALLNSKGGAVAFFGTTRTVFVLQNKSINHAFLRYVLSFDEQGNPITIGEAQRLTKCYLVTSGEDRTANKLQYSLLGDPAVALHLPAYNVVIDSINGISIDNPTSVATMKAGGTARVAGHIEGCPDFNGLLTATVRDSRQLITCNMNSSADADTAFVFYDYNKNLYNGSDSVRNGAFNFRFSVPMDINYSNGNGNITIHAVSDDRRLAHGSTTRFKVGGTEHIDNDSIGPSIYCYLNSPLFTNGGDVNSTPFFVANITDADGINTTGNGIGHDLQLIVDGDVSKTYVLNDNFVYDFGTYTSGTTYYAIPELEPGHHTLQFRAWDILNNSSVAKLDFNVVSGLKPRVTKVSATNNPATTETTFIVTHDRNNGEMDVVIEVFDASGRLLWKHGESGASVGNTYTVKWNLTTDGGQKLQTGVYLYRARVSCDGSSQATKANKLVVIGNK